MKLGNDYTDLYFETTTKQFLTGKLMNEMWDNAYKLCKTDYKPKVYQTGFKSDDLS